MRRYKERIGEFEVMLQQQQQQETTSSNMRKLRDELSKYREKVCNLDRESLAEILDKCCKINVEQENLSLNESEASQTESHNATVELRNEVSQYQAKILELETQQTQYVAHMKNMANKVHYCREENILLRHKIMDIRETVRTFARIKPLMGPNDFAWQRSVDGTIVTMGENSKKK